MTSRKLTRSPAYKVVVFGSGEFVQTLMENDRVDEVGLKLSSWRTPIKGQIRAPIRRTPRRGPDGTARADPGPQ
jgi:hypothetical protein